MRRIPVISLAMLSLGLVACSTAPPDHRPAKVQTTDEADRADVEGVVSTPFRDLNVLRTKIPGVLLAAMADPYGRPPAPANGQAQCAQLAALIQPLDEALGADLDTPPKDADDLLQQGRSTALDAMAGAASGAIPFRGWVRKLSGAERHDGLVKAAITAGAVRRAYLKGVGEAQGCAPPGAPSHALTGRPAPKDAPTPAWLRWGAQPFER